MPETPIPAASTATTADQYFQEKWILSPMVAMFCALPIHDEPLAELRVFPVQTADRNLLIYGGEVNMREGNKTFSRRLNIPNGMIARKMLLYYFSKYYLHPTFVHDCDRPPKDIAEDYGYDNYKSRHAERFAVIIDQIVHARYSFLYHEDNELFGLIKHSDNHNRLFLGESEHGDIKTLFLNPKFMFNCAFPVDFRHVKGSRKKALFWNIYLMLVDVMPRIPQGKDCFLPWTYLHLLFAGNYTNLANFKNEFKTQLKEVEKIYPRIVDRYWIDKKKLNLLYTPPPIPRPVNDKPPPPRNPSPAAPAMALNKVNVA
jgi:hypothetical protein